MKVTGIFRKVDEFGRVVIPVELRRKLDLAIQDQIEFLIDGENVMLRKSTLSCSHCGRIGTIFALGNSKLCGACRDLYTGFAVGYFAVETRRANSCTFAKKSRRADRSR